MADVATLHLGFIAYGPDSDSAYATGLRVSDNISSALTKAGVPEEALESENQSVAPVQEYQVESSPQLRRPNAGSRSPKAGPSAPMLRMPATSSI